MSFDPWDYYGDSAPVRCPNCQNLHPQGYELSACEHNGCGTQGCIDCLAHCSNSDQCGLFCAEHLVATEYGTDEALCFTCMTVDMDADDLIAMGGRAA